MVVVVMPNCKIRDWLLECSLIGCFLSIRGTHICPGHVLAAAERIAWVNWRSLLNKQPTHIVTQPSPSLSKRSQYFSMPTSKSTNEPSHN